MKYSLFELLKRCKLRVYSKLRNDGYIKENCYNEGQSVKEYKKNQNRIHKWLKPIFILPGIWAAKKFLGKYLRKEPPNVVGYKILKIYNEAVEKTLEEWPKVFRLRQDAYKHVKCKPCLLQRMREGLATYMLRAIKEIELTIYSNDCSYNEFNNMKMFNIALLMNKNFDKSAKHIFYTSHKIEDVRYHVIQGSEEEFFLKLVATKKGRKVKDV